MKGKLDHIGIAVQDITDAASVYANFGLEMGHTTTLEASGVKIGFLPVGENGGMPQIELLEPLGPDTTLGKFIERRGEGLHHVCLEVEDIQSALVELAAKGFDLIDKQPRRGGEGMIAFIHPKATKGVLLELIEKDR